MKTPQCDPVEAPGRLLDLAALEDRSSVKQATWRLWLRQRRLPAVRLGRRVLVAEADYNAFVAKSRGK